MIIFELSYDESVFIFLTLLNRQFRNKTAPIILARIKTVFIKEGNRTPLNEKT